MKNSTITKLNKYNHSRIKNFADGSIDANLNALMDAVQDEMPFVDYSEKLVGINVYKTTMERVDGFHITATESRDNIVTRMLIKYDEMQNRDKVWIPFKLTSLLNKNLIITGILDFNSKDILFNESENEYSQKLPDTYSYDGENLTMEFQAWSVMIDWVEIKNTIINNYKEKVSVKTTCCYVDVNYI